MGSISLKKMAGKRAWGSGAPKYSARKQGLALGFFPKSLHGAEDTSINISAI
jgi:hypothetical protein